MANVIAGIMRHGAYHQPPGVPSARLPHPLTDRVELLKDNADLADDDGIDSPC